MNAYRKKRKDIVTAIQVQDNNEDEVKAFLGERWKYTAPFAGKILFISFSTSNKGLRSAYNGSWIVRGEDDELQDIMDSVFRDTYEEVTE